MKYTTLLRSMVAGLAVIALMGMTSCKSRQYVGPVNGKILKAEDLIKDSDKQSNDNDRIEQVNTLEEEKR